MSRSRAAVAGAADCGCPAPPRWRCDLCSDGGGEHLACNQRCLRRHWRHEHDRAARESFGALARRAQALRNAAHALNWDSFAGHRARVTGLLRAVQRGEGLCVLGAGNADDLELTDLVREFGVVHLVDLDAAALERARARVPGALRARVVLHGDVELTGLLDGVERWGDDDRGLAAEAATAIAARLGRTFDVVLSSCVLSQLCVPFTRLLARRPPEWRALMSLLGRTHFQLMAALLREGGSGIAQLGDAYLGPARVDPGPLRWEALDPRVLRSLRDGVMRLRDPAFLAELLAAPPLRTLIEEARLSEPWRWQVEEAAMLVYAVIFLRR